MKKLLYIIPILLFLNGFSLSVVTHDSVTEDSLSASELQKIFLGKKSTWSDGSKIVPVILNSGATHEAFLGLISKSSTQFTAYWQQMLFTGQGVPPQRFETEAELLAFVAATPGAIGYIGGSPADIKVLLISD